MYIHTYIYVNSYVLTYIHTHTQSYEHELLQGKFLWVDDILKTEQGMNLAALIISISTHSCTSIFVSVEE